MPNCPTCGAEVGSDPAVSCPACGRSILPVSNPPDAETQIELQEVVTPAPEPEIPPFPGSIRLAAWIWIFDAVLFILATCAGIVFESMLNVRNPNRPKNPASSCANMAALAMAGGCLIAGIQLVRRKLKDPIAAAILSLIGGILYLGLGIWGAMALGQGNFARPEFEMIMGVAAITGAVVGCGLTLPGVMALLGRSRYREWRRAMAALRKRRQKPRRHKGTVYLDDEPAA